MIDNYGTDEERAEARKKDRDGRWQDVPHKHLADVCGIGGMSFFDPIGWRYYLPAYMTWILSGGETCDSIASDSLFYWLIINRRNQDYYQPRYNALKPEEKEAVRAFLRFVSGGGLAVDWYMEDANTALANYWEKLEKVTKPLPQ